MVWLLLGFGFFLMVSGILGQVYSLKTKRGVLHPRTRYWRLLARSALVLAGLLLILLAANRIPGTGHR
jgi:uncharacterized membrane protein HdeD (DUF308 family)